MRRCIYDDVECRLSREGLGRHGDKMHNVWHQRSGGISAMNANMFHSYSVETGKVSFGTRED